MSSALISNAIPLTQIAYASTSITSSYTVAGKFTSPLVSLKIISTLDQAVQISFDGVNNHIVSPAGSTVPSIVNVDFKDFLTRMPTPSISVKTIGSPTTGSIYFCGFTAQTP